MTTEKAGKPRGKMILIQVCLSKDVHKALFNYAESKAVKLGTAARMVISEALKKGRSR